MAVVERLALLIDAQTGGAISDLNRLNAEINRTNKTQVEATGVTGAFERGLQKLGIQSNNTAALLKAGVAAAATSAAYAMFRFGKDAVASTVEFTDSVRRIQQTVGGTAEQASKLNAILDDYGITGDQAAKSFARLGRNVADNGQALSQYGIDIARSRDGAIDLQQTILNVADAYKSTTDPATRAKLVNDAFGRSGADLIPILEQGRAGIENLFKNVPKGQVITQDQLDAALEYKLAMDNLNDSITEIKVALGNLLIPELTATANSMADAVRAIGDVSDAANSVGVDLGGLYKVVRSGIDPIFALTNAWTGLKAKLGIDQESTKLADAQKRVADATEALSKAAADSSTKDSILRDRKRDLTEATDAYDRIQRRVNDALDAAKAKTDAATDATRAQIQTAYEVAASQLGVEGALMNVERAGMRYSEVMGDVEATDLDRREALNQAELAALAYGQAVLKASQDAGDASSVASRKQIDALAAVAGSLDPASPLRVFLDQYIQKLNNEIPEFKKTKITATYDPILMELYFGGQRALGGPVGANTAYLVGEKGPELFVPGTSGTIIPNDQLQPAMPAFQMSGGIQGAGPTTINLNVDGKTISRIVRDDLIAIGRANGSALGAYA